MAVDRAHIEIAKIFDGNPNVDIKISSCVPFTPMMKTLVPGGLEGDGIEHTESFTQLLIKAHREEIRKPLVAVIDAGEQYDPMAKMLLEAGIPVFRSADVAIRTVGVYAKNKLKYGSPRFIS